MPDIQEEIIAFLEQQASSAGNFRRVETHISLIFMGGDRVFKLKKAVKLPYADFSTPELRLAACENEVALNRRTAPDLYRGVRPITRAADGRPEFDGTGPLLDAVVDMNRFDENDLFDRLAERDALTLPLMDETAVAIAGFHAKAAVLHKGGGAANLEAVLDINRAGFATSDVFQKSSVESLDAALRASLARHAALLDERERTGKLRLCHGDLHLRNIYRSTQGPRLFDCIEFNDAIASIDVLYDLAFLLMDLWHRNRADLANSVANRYLDRMGDDGGFRLLPFLMAIRAEVRAHVTATQAMHAGEGRDALAASAEEYFNLARTLLLPKPPRLIAIGGLSGTGKSTLAMAIAPHLGAAPGARLLESDRIRKALFNTEPNARLPIEAYRPEVSAKVYETLAVKAKTILEGGGTAVVDAVFEHPEDRARMAAIAGDLGISFTGLWLQAAPEVLRARVAARCQGDSDATTDILEKQLARDPGAQDWKALDATAPLAELSALAEQEA